MRSTADMSTVRVGRPRRRIIAVIAVVALVVLFFLLRWFAWLYTQSLWYSSINQHEVFTTVLATKIGLFLVFGLVFFLAMWGNLLLCNRLGPSELFLDAPEDELVRRFQAAVRPYAGRVYALLSFVLALVAASSTLGRWQQYLLFANAKNFEIKDPLFGKDVGFYVFRLPFITFIVDWILASLFAIIIFTAVFHYLNGGIRAARVSPRVAPGVKVHLSVLLALLALAKAAGYLLARWHMVTSTSSGIFEGAGYTDVHARMPALMLLFFLCLLAAVILLVNIWQRGWTLPIIAVGLWAFVALVVGVIYPAILQAVKVTPAQSSLEQPYIARNIEGTRGAYAVDRVEIRHFDPSASRMPLAQQPGVAASLADIRQWDPSSQVSQQTFQQLQSLKNYYGVSQVGEDRYTIGTRPTPIVEALRQLNPAGVPNPTWVNTHLQYTHGLGIVMAPSNAVQNGGAPPFTEKGLPPTNVFPFPAVSQPRIYFGLNQSGFVIVDSKATELDFEQHASPTYTGGGGVQMGGFFRRFMFFVRFGDLNLLLSNLVTPQSRIIYMRDVVQIAQQAAPFLSIDSHPYAAIIDGRLEWILDGYTTTDQYPYSQNASTQLVPADTGLPGSYNYVRNSVKIVVDAYTGHVYLYAWDPSDPILRAWSSAFPGLIQPLGKLPSGLRPHLRYPPDMFAAQAAIFGRYHLTTPPQFYSNATGWSLSPTDGVGPPTNTIQLTPQTNRQGFVVSESVARMDPVYQIYALPGQTSPQFTLTDAYVTATSTSQSSSANSGVLNLTAFMVALSDPGQYGKIEVYVPPLGASILGPLQAASAMNGNPPASQKMSLLHSTGSTVTLGNVLMVPIDGSILYVRPMYVASSSTNIPLLKYELTVYKNHLGFATTLQTAIAQVLSGAPSGGGTQGLTARELLARAHTAYQHALAALAAGELGRYQQLVEQSQRFVAEAYARLGGSGSGR